jgi:hypothetical protein
VIQDLLLLKVLKVLKEVKAHKVVLAQQVSLVLLVIKDQ